MSTDDLSALFRAQDDVARWRAERENATARLELAQQREAMAFLISQHEPLHSLGIDRKAMATLLAFVRHHDRHRLNREIAALSEGEPIA